MNKWIKTEDELPPEGEYVLCQLVRPICTSWLHTVQAWEEFTSKDEAWFRRTMSHWQHITKAE